MATRVITVIADDDDAFFGWLVAHPDGYFLNPTTSPPGLMLHRTTCPHYKGEWHDARVTSTAKFCTDSRRDLEQVSPGSSLCTNCFD